MESKSVTIRFHEELNDFLRRHQSGHSFVVPFHGRRTVKDLVESLGVPHVEIDRIEVQGAAVGLSYLVQDHDDIQVHPGFHLKQAPRFVVDDNVAKLSPLLRMLGFDTLYAQGATDSWIATISKQEKRTVVSRDIGLLKRKDVHSGLFVRATRPKDQLAEVVDRLQIKEYCQPFCRCLHCNHGLIPLPAEDAEHHIQIPPGVRTWTNEFFQCPGCLKVFWKGSHHQSMEALVHHILDPTARPAWKLNHAP